MFYGREDLLEQLGALLERPMAALVSAAPFHRKAHSRGEGYQIDLLLQTRRTVWIVEIKRKREIGCEVID